MRIYPDPELPDLKVTWFDFDCMDATADVGIVVTGVDTPTTVLMQTAPCTDLELKFVNLARERYRVTGTTYDTSGAMGRTADEDADLRAGFDKTVSFFFQAIPNFSVEWQFTNGDSCASLGATDVTTYFSLPGMPDAFGYGAPCEAMVFTISMPAGTYTARVRASDGNGFVAAGPEIAEFVVGNVLTDLGVQLLTACSGSACP